MRKLVVFIAAVLALGLGVTGVYALTGGGSSSGAGPGPAVTSVPTSPSATAAVTSSTPPATPRPSTTAPPTPDPTALADGTYPTFVRAVDLDGATVEVDVLQIFVGAEAHQATIEDGVSWNDVRFNPVYIHARLLQILQRLHMGRRRIGSGFQQQREGEGNRFTSQPGADSGIQSGFPKAAIQFRNFTQ